MDVRFAGIKVIIWDFDGTLYKPDKALWQEVRESEYKTIMHVKGWDHEKAVTAFDDVYKKKTESATEAVALICDIPTARAAITMEDYYDRRPYLARDEQLISLFQKLASFRHVMLANGVRRHIEDSLSVLGIPKETFEEIVTSETVGVNKPNDDGFRYILDKTKLPAAVHLMIGDRESVDLAPAKHLGMKTCFVWSQTVSEIADVTIPTVYDLPLVL